MAYEEFNAAKDAELHYAFQRYVADSKQYTCTLKREMMYTEEIVKVEYYAWFSSIGNWETGYDAIIKALNNPDKELPNIHCRELHIQLDNAESTVERLSEQLKNSCNLTTPPNKNSEPLDDLPF